MHACCCMAGKQHDKKAAVHPRFKRRLLVFSDLDTVRQGVIALQSARHALRDMRDTHSLYETLASSSRHFGGATSRQILHLLSSSSDIQRSITGLSWAPRSVTWNASSWMTVGCSCPTEGQYHRSRSADGGGGERRPTPKMGDAPSEPSGRTRSMTRPTVSANRTGL